MFTVTVFCWYNNNNYVCKSSSAVSLESLHSVHHPCSFPSYRDEVVRYREASWIGNVILFDTIHPTIHEQVTPVGAIEMDGDEYDSRAEGVLDTLFDAVDQACDKDGRKIRILRLSDKDSKQVRR